MKKIFIILILVLVSFTQFTPYLFAAESDAVLSPSQIATQYGYTGITAAYDPEGAINVSQTGQILYNYHGNKKWYLASMTKLMTMYLTLEAVKKGDLSLDDKVKITQNHYRMSTLPELSNTKLYPGEVYTIAELLQITVSNSSNAAALILANKVSGNVTSFTKLMNKKAQELGMTHTYFTNPTGAENTQLQEFAPKLTTNDNNSTSTAKDYAILDQHVIADTPNILHFTKQLAPTQHGVTYYTFNHSLEGASLSLPGTDGLKTGSSDIANYNHTITTKRGKFRINQVILGVGDYNNLGGEKERNKMGNAIMESSFNQYAYKKVLSKGEHNINGKTYYIKKDLYDVVPKTLHAKDYQFVINDGEVHLDYKRQFISKQYGPPTVQVQKPMIHKADTIAKSTWKDHPIITSTAIGLLIIAIALIVYQVIKRLFKRK